MKTHRNAAKHVVSTDIPPWKLWEETDRAERAIRFIETYLVIPKGYGSGSRLRLAQFQKDWLRSSLKDGITSSVLSLPRGNGKSSLLAALAVWSLFDEDETTGAPVVPVVATTINQAIRSVYGVCLAFIAAEPELSNRSIKYSAIGSPKTICPRNNGELFPVSSDVDGLQGLDPSLAVCDEIGFQPQESWDALLLASGKRPRSLVVGIGTPGLDRDNALWHLRTLVHEAQVIPGFLFTEYAADHGQPVGDTQQWRKANPALREGFMNEAALETALALSPEASFRTFRLGQWIDGQAGWLGADGRSVWDALATRYSFTHKQPVWVGVDVGIKRDSTAVCIVGYKPDGKLHAQVKLWIPTTETPVDVTDVMNYLRQICSQYQCGAVSYDPRFFDVPAAMLHDEGLPLIEVPQSPERMTPIIGNLYELLMTGGMTHDGDAGVTQQVLNAIPRFNERGFTLQKSKSRGRIDAAISIALAVDRAQHKTKPKPAIVVL